MRDSEYASRGEILILDQHKNIKNLELIKETT